MDTFFNSRGCPLTREVTVINILLPVLLMADFHELEHVKSLNRKMVKGPHCIQACVKITAPVNNMRNLKFKSLPTPAFFAAVDQCGGNLRKRIN